MLPNETIAKVYNEYRHRIDSLARTLPDFQYEITPPCWHVPANDVSLKEPVVQSLLAAHAGVLGKVPAVKAFVGGTDAPNLGFPTVICGPGSIDQAHSKSEYVAARQLFDAVRVYLWVAVDLLL